MSRPCCPGQPPAPNTRPGVLGVRKSRSAGWVPFGRRRHCALGNASKCLLLFPESTQRVVQSQSAPQRKGRSLPACPAPEPERSPAIGQVLLLPFLTLEESEGSGFRGVHSHFQSPHMEETLYHHACASASYQAHIIPETCCIRS